jgi:2,4-dienoyl-CoA reductase-like NADH-dependent reductase (Old Yellow Enzyme family)
MKHRKFDYASKESLQKDMDELGISLPFSDELSVLNSPLPVNGNCRIKNRLFTQPIEGSDALSDGSPSARTMERYRLFSESGAGMIWVESVSVNQEGRSNPSQLAINDANLGAFKTLVKSIQEVFPKGRSPFTVIQLTHSGRYSKTQPVCAFNNPLIPKENARIASDDELALLEDEYVRAACLAEKAGFDAVDIRACHGYLINELLGAYTRDGIYGGSFENRTRFLRNVVKKVRQACSIDIALRLNVFDGLPYPYGFGVSSQTHSSPLCGKLKIDLREPLSLIGLLVHEGLSLVNISAGIGAYCPQVIRPSDSGGALALHEHPLEGVARMLTMTRTIKGNYPDLVVGASALTWLRHFASHVASGCISEGWFDAAGFGRQIICGPLLIKDMLLGNARASSPLWCRTCNACMAILKKGEPVRCVYEKKECLG